jgi:hypothetical protein
VRPPGLEGSRQADQAMARFLDEARAILHELEEGWIRGEAARPPEGSEELRRRMVEEAMDHLRGRGRGTAAALEEAGAALRRLLELV